MKTIPAYFLLLCLLIGSCKKDTSNLGIITLSLNGTAKSYSIYTNALTNIDTLGIQGKTLVLASAGVVAGPALNTGVAVVLEQNLALPGSASFSLGAYKDVQFDTACNGPVAFPVGCSGFIFSYYDMSMGSLNQSSTDSTGLLTVTAFSSSSNLISGTFSCQMSDVNGALYQVTNGKFTNVPFVVQ